MAKQATAPAKALNNGNSAFRQDGSWVLEVCQALRQNRKDYEAAQSKLVSATEDRDAWTKELADMDDEPTKAQKDRCADLVKTEQRIKELRDRIKSLAGGFVKIIKKADEGGFEEGMTGKQMLKDALEEDEEESEGGQMKLGAGAKAGKEVGPAADWHEQFHMNPSLFGDRDWALVKEHFDKLRKLEVGKKANVYTPLSLAQYIRHRFHFLNKTDDRSGILPSSPKWFNDGLDKLMAAHVAGEHSKGDEAKETDSSIMVTCLQDAAELDVDAWLAICGGKDSDLNKAIVKAKAA